MISVDDIVKARFTPTKFREGYNQDAVDDFLDLLVECMRDGRGPVKVPRFPAVRWREGYDGSEVDDFLDKLREAGLVTW